MNEYLPTFYLIFQFFFLFFFFFFLLFILGGGKEAGFSPTIKNEERSAENTAKSPFKPFLYFLHFFKGQNFSP